MAYKIPKEEDSPSPSTDVQKIASLPSQSFPIQELRGLDFFLQKMSKLLDWRCPQLWGTIAPQLASSSPSLRHGLVALSGIYEQKVYGTNSKEYSLSNYNVAIRMLLNVRKQPIALIDQLLGCLLFIVIEFIQGNVAMAVELIKAGRKILYASRHSKKTATQEAFLTPIEDTFRRLDAHVLEMCHHALEPDLSFGKCWNLDQHKVPDVLNFDNEVQAIRCLGLLMNTWGVAMRSGPLDHSSFHDALLQWRQKFESLSDVDHRSKIARMMWWHECEVMILLQADLDKVGQVFSMNKQGWDKYETSFLKIVCLGEELMSTPGVVIPAFSLCPNVTSVMFRAAIRCRSPLIRRRAIRIIEVANTQEGMLKPEWVLQITRKIVDLEENGLSVTSAEDIPQSSRLWDVSIDWNPSAPSALQVNYYIGGKIVIDRLGEGI